MTIPFTTGVLVATAELNVLARAHWRKLTTKDVVNTVATVDLLNAEITVDAGAMSTNRMIRATLVGDYLNNTGGAQNGNLLLKFGATSLWGDTLGGGGGIASSATRHPWMAQFTIANLGATNSQQVGGFFWFGLATAGAAAGVGTIGTAFSAQTAFGTPITGTAAEDTTAAKALVFSMTHNAANAALSIRLLNAVVEVV